MRSEGFSAPLLGCVRVMKLKDPGEAMSQDS